MMEGALGAQAKGFAAPHERGVALGAINSRELGQRIPAELC